MAHGRLRIYLGAAPGVGKTMAMLAEGARRQARGTDVVVGLCETHGRAHTARMLEGLEVVPRRQVEHRGAALTEMDLDAVLARKPQVALVDELAHTDAPGSRHPKRWQDVQDLLAAGIDVVSTVNIQHLESLNDAVEAITGIVQQETIPDHVVRAADQIELVDMTPEALRRRMAHGNVYQAATIDAALSNYFRVGNLAALRELALLWLADRVEEGLDKYRADHGIEASWPTRERVVVAVSGGPEGDTLLRRGARLASRGAGGELLAVYVARSDGLAGAPLDVIAADRRLVEELGGTFHTVSGDDPAEAILAFARGVNATTILLGLSHRSRWRSVFSPGIGEGVIADSGDIDVHVVTHSYARSGRRYPRSAGLSGLSGRRVAQGFVAAVAGPALLTLLLTVLPNAPELPLIVQLYLVLTIATAMLGGLRPALCAAVLSSLAINWFFTPPVGTLTIYDPENAAAVALFVLVAAAVSFVVHRSARRAAEAIAAQQESTALAELSHTLLSSTDQLALLLRRAVDMFGVEAAAVVRRSTSEEIEDVVAATEGFVLSGNGYAASEPADDAHDLVLTGQPLPARRQRLFAAYAAHAGAILNRRQLQASASQAQELGRDNRARTALLSAVSHDLRTPLAGIKAAIGSLRSSDVEFSAEDEAELKAAIEESADRLEALIGNLLDMSRLQVGALVTHVRAIDLGEVIPAAVAATPSPERVRWSLGADARRALADPGLLDRVLGNVIENALRHQPPPGTIQVGTSRHVDGVQIRVVDTGPGVPHDHQDRIFRPFQRADDSGGEGVGLGLAVARGLTEAMGGTVDAEDTPGGGMTMVITLPAVPGPS